MTLFIYKKFISFSLPLFFLLNPIFAEQLLTKSEILRKSNECFKDLQYKICSNLFLEIEQIQLIQSEQKKYELLQWFWSVIGDKPTFIAYKNLSYKDIIE